MPLAADDKIYGLDAETIARINGIFARVPEIERVILYGSRAKGNFRPGSDIDLAMTGKDLSFDHLLRVDALLDDLSMPYTIDLHLLDNIENPTLREHINRVGICLYARAPSWVAPLRTQA